MAGHDDDHLMTPAEVAATFRVDAKTVGRWEKTGRIGCVRTPGRHRRYWASEVRAILTGENRDPGDDGGDAA